MIWLLKLRKISFAGTTQTETYVLQAPCVTIEGISKNAGFLFGFKAVRLWRIKPEFT